MRQDYIHGHRLLRTLDHKHVVKVHDIIDEPDLFAVVTEPLSGTNLHRHLHDRGIIHSEAEVVRIMQEVASGLEHAHERGVVFGNLRPTNVEIFSDGTAKIFAHPKLPHQFTTFMDAADYLGYHVYCPPELLRCEPLDQRTDIYGLGLCAYELIVSRLPHQSSDNLGAVLWSLANREWPIPTEIVQEMNPLLNKIVVRCLQKDPSKRYASVAELKNDLTRVQARSTPLISSVRLQEIVTSAFPEPLAVLARALEREDHLLAQKDKLLNLANGLVSYLGFLAAVGLGRPLAREYTRPSLGHWVALLRQVFQDDEAKQWPLPVIRTQLANGPELFKALNEVLKLRNRMAHAPAPEEGAVLHDWVSQMTACLRCLFKSLLFLANYSVVVVEDLDFLDDRFQVTLRRLDGLGDHETLIRVMSAQPHTKGRVYLAAADCSRLVSLHPWVIHNKCPLCFQRELFFYVSADQGQVHYVTPDRGHNISCPVPSELKAMGEAGQ